MTHFNALKIKDFLACSFRRCQMPVQPAHTKYTAVQRLGSQFLPIEDVFPAAHNKGMKTLFLALVVMMSSSMAFADGKTGQVADPDCTTVTDATAPAGTTSGNNAGSSDDKKSKTTAAPGQ